MENLHIDGLHIYISMDWIRQVWIEDWHTYGLNIYISMDWTSTYLLIDHLPIYGLNIYISMDWIRIVWIEDCHTYGLNIYISMDWTFTFKWIEHIQIYGLNIYKSMDWITYVCIEDCHTYGFNIGISIRLIYLCLGVGSMIDIPINWIFRYLCHIISVIMPSIIVQITAVPSVFHWMSLRWVSLRHYSLFRMTLCRALACLGTILQTLALPTRQSATGMLKHSCFVTIWGQCYKTFLSMIYECS